MDITSILEPAKTARYLLANRLIRAFGLSIVALCFTYLLNNYLNVWYDWPGVAGYFLSENSEGSPALAWLQLVSYLLPCFIIIVWVFATETRLMIRDSERLSTLSAFIIRVAFWSVVFIGLIDGLISWLRVEDLLPYVVGDNLATNLGRSDFRGSYVHIPLIFISGFFAFFYKNISVSWLALLVVFSEAWIVMARFIFSYEQTLMGDLVRFWYAALLLFASAYTLREEGHVRVDVVYASRSIRYKAWANIVGVLVLALPLCWTILLMGMWERSSILNGPLLNFEISQASYGLFIKYLMAAFLIVFAVTMMIQFISYLLRNAAILAGEVAVEDDHRELVTE